MDELQAKNMEMPYKQLKIIFMGTPEFAVASLDALHKAGCNIIAVITAPDKPAGRGMKLNESAVKIYAKDHNLKILQPEKLKNPGFLEELSNLQADLQIVVAFRMLPEQVWNMPPLGTINLHGSLLPQYRGAAPINWAIINGEKETGLTTFKLQHEIDTGNILMQQPVLIGDDETAGELHDRMKEIGAQLLVKTIERLGDGKLTEIPQSETTKLVPSSKPHDGVLHHAPKIFTENCNINWNRPAIEVYNLIRGLSPYPGAFSYFKNKMLKIYKAEKEIISPIIKSGDYDTDQKSYLRFACVDGYIRLKEIQLEGKKRMSIEEFLRGQRF